MKHLMTIFGLVLTVSAAHANQRFIQVEAKDKFARSKIADTGMSIETTRSDSVWGFADTASLKELKKGGFKILGNFDAQVARGGHTQWSTVDFPPADGAYHNYDETLGELRMLTSKHADIVKLSSLGKSTENRDIWALHINTDSQALQNGVSSKPGAVFMGAHHAREHLSVEVPLLLLKYILENRKDAAIAQLLETRDLWFIPMVNPDGTEYDISKSGYQLWRKNRRSNSDGTFGVDLNRNYGFKWGTGGSSNSPSSDVYMGEAPFSEPETQTIRDFVDAHLNIKVLTTYHTFSELILYPWGHSYDPIGNNRDFLTHKKIAEKMATWNGYTPQQASDLYIASGDTTDWAYGTHGIVSFTFELSPNQSVWMPQKGFYPGAGIIEKTFQANIKPCLYLIELADNPHKVLDETQQPVMY